MPLYRRRIWYSSNMPSLFRAGQFSFYFQHAYAVEYLFQFLNPGSRVLDVGSGSGYTCAVFHHLVNSEDDRPGLVVGIDHIDALVQSSISNLKKDGLEKALRDKQIMMITGDGRKGDPEERTLFMHHLSLQ